jgi:2-(1,2-epoxy-1,2-dihydrophenyl)acetyl-CoA isomerase
MQLMMHSFQRQARKKEATKMSNNEPVVTYETKDGVATIRFNRPKQLNALNRELAQGFGAALDGATSDPAARVIVVAGQGRAFMAGGDLGVFRDASNKPEAARALIEVVHGALRALADAPQIVVASLHGAVAGAGMSLALNADLAIASDETTFNMAYARIAAPPDCGGTWALPRVVGLRRALEIALLSDTIGAEEALRLGLVNRVVAASDLKAETAKLAVRLAAGPAIAYARIKRLIRDSFGHSLSEQLDAERDAFTACAGTQDFSEALDAFFAKRKPEFRAR